MRLPVQQTTTLHPIEIHFQEPHTFGPDADVFLFSMGKLFFHCLDACLSAGRRRFRSPNKTDHFFTIHCSDHWLAGWWLFSRLARKEKRVEI